MSVRLEIDIIESDKLSLSILFVKCCSYLNGGNSLMKTAFFVPWHILRVSVCFLSAQEFSLSTACMQEVNKQRNLSLLNS